jgi:hypothetical protein
MSRAFKNTAIHVCLSVGRSVILVLPELLFPNSHEYNMESEGKKLCLRTVCLAHLSTVPTLPYLQFSQSGHSSRHTSRRPAFPQALIKHSVRSIGSSSEDWNCSNSKVGARRPATAVLGANVADSVPPYLPDVDVGSRPEEHADSIFRAKVPTARSATSCLLDPFV